MRGEGWPRHQQWQSLGLTVETVIKLNHGAGKAGQWLDGSATSNQTEVVHDSGGGVTVLVAEVNPGAYLDDCLELELDPNLGPSPRSYSKLNVLTAGS
jgi:hypothetical protein